MQTAALIVWVSSAWLHLSFPLIPAGIAVVPYSSIIVDCTTFAGTTPTASTGGSPTSSTRRTTPPPTPPNPKRHDVRPTPPRPKSRKKKVVCPAGDKCDCGSGWECPTCGSCLNGCVPPCPEAWGQPESEDPTQPGTSSGTSQAATPGLPRSAVSKFDGLICQLVLKHQFCISGRTSGFSQRVTTSEEEG